MNKCRLCNKFVGTVSVAIDTDTLVLNIPEATYNDCQKLCLAILQELPAAATINMPVAITIGTGTTEYPLVTCDGNPVLASNLSYRGFYKIKVQTNATTAVFKVISGICQSSNNLLAIS